MKENQRPGVVLRSAMTVVLSLSLAWAPGPTVVLADDGAGQAPEGAVAADVEAGDLPEGEGGDPGDGQGGTYEGADAGGGLPADGEGQGEGEAPGEPGAEAGDIAEGDVTDEAEGEPEEAAVPAQEEQEAAEPTDGLEGESAEIPAEGQAPSEQEPEDGAEVGTTAARRDISKAKVSAIAAQAYTGNAVKPRPTVRYGTATLALGTDYTLSYKNNIKPGTATVTVTGRGAYAGTKSVTFKIVAPSVSYRTHVQNVGWQGWRKDGAMSGTSGRALRLEGINIKLSSKPVTGGITYRTHVQNVGWQGWRKDGAMSGTSGQALRLEAIQIKLTGKMAERYDVYYRVHCQNIGWMGWARNGQSAGSAGYAYRLEGIQIALVPKGKAGPGATYKGITQTTSKRFVEKSRNEKLYNAYKAILVQAKQGQGVFQTLYKGYSANRSTEDRNKYIDSIIYSLFDMNSDGTPELLVRVGWAQLGTETFYFTYKGGKVVYLGHEGIGTWYGNSSGQLYFFFSRQGSSRVTLLSISNSSLKAKEVLKYYDYNERYFDRAMSFLKSKGAKELETSKVTSYNLLSRSCTK